MKLSSPKPSQSYESEQKKRLERPVAEQIICAVDKEKAAQREKIKKELEVEITVQLKAELAVKIEAEVQHRLEQEYQQKLAQAIANSVQSKQELTKQPKRTININMETKQIVEAILFAAEKPMTVKQLQKIYPEIERPELTVIQNAIDSIIEDYAARPIALKHLSSGYRFQVKEGYSYWVSRIFEDKPPKYSRALLETVAIIAYRQPVTRGDIEDIRGVSVSSNIIRTLLDREWIRVIAHKEVPGRPALYGSTKQFLDYFNLSSLGQLPTLEEIKECDFEAKELELNNNALTHPQNEKGQNAKLEGISAKEQRVEEKSKQESEKKECE